MNTIEISKAKKEFGCDVRVGEYVAWWISDDRQASMTLVSKSYQTEAECESAADEMLDDSYLADTEGRTLRQNGYVSLEIIGVDE